MEEPNKLLPISPTSLGPSQEAVSQNQRNGDLEIDLTLGGIGPPFDSINNDFI